LIINELNYSKDQVLSLPKTAALSYDDFKHGKALVSAFHCQQFSLHQQQTAMKVCTDSLLFGAMAPIQAGDRVLDIGTGCGLLALMAAQLGAAAVTAVELCPLACQEAQSNFQNSRWAPQLQAVNQSIQDFAINDDGADYDIIISNPPFFADQLKSKTPQKRQARHTDSLPFAELISAVNKLLAASGVFYVLLPCRACAEFEQLAETAGLYLHSRLDYQGFVHTPAKVAALCFRRIAARCATGSMTIYTAPQVYTAASSQYLQDFLLRLRQ
jgi:tRNA1Val (adenine37-N6)-methyltransferase